MKLKPKRQCFIYSRVKIKLIDNFSIHAKMVTETHGCAAFPYQGAILFCALREGIKQ